MNIYFRLFALICLFTVVSNYLQAQSTTRMLDRRIDVIAENISVKEVLGKISNDYGIEFSYSNDVISLPQRVTVIIKEKPLKMVLDQILTGSNVIYKVSGNQIVFQAIKTNIKPISFSGYVENLKSGERLIGCIVYDSTNNVGVLTNTFGYFNLPLKGCRHNLTIRYLGYINKALIINIGVDTTVVIKLEEATVTLKEVIVTNSSAEASLLRPQIGLMAINSKDVKKLPNLLGEADIMRAIQILPGIQSANERSTGISVRGGSIDQNLFLLDDAPVFQISHMMGFYSIFNNDAVKDIKVYKGDIPANYGGRLASLVDIRLKDGNMRNFAASGGIGIIASDLSIEGPIVNDRVSFIVSGKYSYIGTLVKTILPNINLSFYDLNCKLNAKINAKNRIYFSSYTGGDKSLQSTSYRNNTLTLRWNHIYNPKLFSNVSFIYSKYMYTSGSTDSSLGNYSWTSGIKEFALKADYNYFANAGNTLDFGISTSYSLFTPGKLDGNQQSLNNITKTTPFSNRVVTEQNVLDHSVYISNVQKITEKLSFRYGLRASLYQVIGGHWVYKLTNYYVTDSFYVSKNSTYFNYLSVEPRLSINYRCTHNSALKASYTYTSQQTQLLMRTNGGGPLDVWFPSDNNIKPQTSSQISCGYVYYFFNNLLEASIESYYKTMNNIIDYKDGATFLAKSSTIYVNKTTYNFEEQLRTGIGYSYGTELSLNYDFNKINGIVSYTYAHSKRRIPDINSGKSYLSPFDKPHTFDVFLNFNLTNRISLSTNFRRQSGQVTTIPVYVAIMFGKAFQGYSNRNAYRLPYYSRVDISMTIKTKEKPNKKYHSEWNFSVINITNHANIQYVNFIPSTENPDIIQAKGIFMLGFIPSIAYHFNF